MLMMTFFEMIFHVIKRRSEERSLGYGEKKEETPDKMKHSYLLNIYNYIDTVYIRMQINKYNYKRLIDRNNFNSSYLIHISSFICRHFS